MIKLTSLGILHSLLGKIEESDFSFFLYFKHFQHNGLCSTYGVPKGQEKENTFGASCMSGDVLLITS